MAGWSREKRRAFEDSFYEFLGSVFISSKDTGARTCLGTHLYDAQVRFFNTVFDALEADIHEVDCLKSRQLGVSTASRALSTFYLGMHDGLPGAFVLDTDFNRKAARDEIESMIDNLPRKLKFPTIVRRNREGLALTNQSRLLFFSAGVRQSKTSGTLGRSVGLSFAHLSELCSYDNEEGIEAFEQSLSDINPDRLYIRESTARGFNSWHTRWVKAREDTAHCACVFLGWWSKPTQQIGRTQPDFERYGLQPPSDKEMKMIAAVKERYGHQIAPEQLAWYRRKLDPNAKPEGDAPAEYVGNVTRVQEQPSVEEEAFQFTGSVFFEPADLADQANKNVSKNFKTYTYATGQEFVDMRVHKPVNSKMVQLKVWEEPVEESVYVISADPAFGSNEHNDRSACQVLRCYADGLDQVAEYAWPLIGTRPFAWVLASLMGWYAGERSEVYNIIELNGPGEAVWNEMKYLKHHIATGYQPQEIAERGLQNVFRNVRNYIYGRSDAMQPGRNYQWKTNSNLKVSIMERLRDFVSNGMMHVRSIETLDEMKSVTRDGDSIGAQGSKKDDRVIALALAVRCWEERVRKSLSTQKRTRENEVAKRRMTIVDQGSLYANHQLDQFFAVKRAQRLRENRELTRARWRHR